MSRVFLEVDKGASGHSSVSLMCRDDDLQVGCGTRIIGPKAWGGSRTIQSWELKKENLEEIIEECLGLLAVMNDD